MLSFFWRGCGSSFAVSLAVQGEAYHSSLADLKKFLPNSLMNRRRDVTVKHKFQCSCRRKKNNYYFLGDGGN